MLSNINRCTTAQVVHVDSMIYIVTMSTSQTNAPLATTMPGINAQGASRA